MLLLFRDGLAGSHQVFQIESDGLLRVGDAFFGGLTVRDAAWKSGHGYRVPPFQDQGRQQSNRYAFLS